MFANPFTTLAQKVIIGGLGAAVVALGAYSITQHFTILNTRLDLSHEISERATETAMRESTARIFMQRMGDLRTQHSKDIKEKDDAFQTRIKNVQDAALADALRQQRLLADSENRAASYRRLADSGPAACKRLADKATEFDAIIAEGIGVEQEGRSLIEQRDAQIDLLLGIIDKDRAAVEAARQR